MVRSTALPLLILVAISLIPTEVGAESITYNMVNYSFTSPYTVTGTITTDGTTGTSLPDTDITDWHITIQLGTATVATLDPSNGTVSGNFDATAFAITTGPLPNLEFSTGLTQRTVPLIEWFPTGHGFAGYNGILTSGGHPPEWSAEFPFTAPIATVPEPSSAALASIGAVGAFLAYGRSRHRRSQRRQAAA